MNNIIIRKAEFKDIELLADLRIEFLSEYWGSQSPGSVAELRSELIKFFKKEITDGSYISCIAYDDTKAVSVAGMKIIQKPGSFRIPDGWSGYIMNMYTKPEYRKQGIGKQILDSLIDHGKKLNIRFFELHSTEEGEPLYIKYGFHKHKEPTYRYFT